MSFEDQTDEIPSESSTETTEQQSTSESSEEGEPAAAAAPAPAEDNVPFHKHPRFQELIQERNTFKEQIEAQAKVLQSLQEQVKKSTPAERDELMERLANIDPQFGKLVKTLRDDLAAAKQQIADFNNWRTESAAQSHQQRAQSISAQFFTENKISDDRKPIYEAMVKQAAASNPRLTVDDLPAVLKQVHDNLGKMFQTVGRDANKQLIADKKAIAAKPSTLPKGAPAQAKKQDQNLSKAELLAAIKAEALTSARAEKEI